MTPFFTPIFTVLPGSTRPDTISFASGVSIEV
jgi:hypothetical protein